MPIKGVSKARLKPCPFCGSEAYVVMQYVGGLSSENLRWSISCMGAEVGCGYTFFDCDTEDDAIELWNRRDA